MKKLKNWNDWCNDKLLLTSIDDGEVLISVNTILGLERVPSQNLTQVMMVDGYMSEVTEDIDEILGYIAEGLKASEERRAAMYKMPETVEATAEEVTTGEE